MKAAKSFYLLTTVGLQLVVSILIGLALGILIDNRFGSKPFGMLLFMLFGTAAGFLNVYRMATKEDRKGSDDDSCGE